uniref:Reverse transcriptase domain-containing protein n=1 Tax=Photinus pyralis TaxID=7054 RepID=A0A1Y1LAN8_PHOPY
MILHEELKYIRIAHLNVRSITNNFLDFKHVLANDYDVIGVTETWLTSDTPSYAVSIPNYRFERKDRTTRTWGGGVGVYIRNNLQYDLNSCASLQSSDSLEQIWINLRLHKVRLAIGTLYRRQEFPFSEFLDDFENCFVHLLPTGAEVICIGDLNIDLGKFANNHAVTFLTLVEVMGLRQVVQEPTRVSKTTSSLIDLIILPSDKTIDTVGVIPMDTVTDHHLVFCEYPINDRLTTKDLFHTYRDFKHFDLNHFNQAMQLVSWDHIYSMTDPNDMVTFLNMNILYIFDQLAPIKTARISKPKAPWLTDTIRRMFLIRDRALIKFKKTKNECHWKFYKVMRNYTNAAVNREKKAYLDFISKSDNEIWGRLKELHVYNNIKSSEIPCHLDDVNKINAAFAKICNASCTVELEKLSNFYNNTPASSIDNKLEFFGIDEGIVLHHLMKIKSKCIGSDGISLKMLIICCPLILPHLVFLFNSCMVSGIFPEAWKLANITPLPKIKHPVSFSDLRPISILPVLSKVFERILTEQINTHVSNFNALPVTQSGFRPGHSCVTSLLSITNDIIKSTDQGKLTALILLDYSKAFDTLNHNILVDVLHRTGFGDKACSLLRSYLTNRRQQVVKKKNVSHQLFTTSGVPQGSVLGPVLFSLYTSKFQFALKHLSAYQYADDTQLLYSFHASDVAQANDNMSSDIDYLVEISELHGLKINTSKCSVMLFGPIKDRELVKNCISIKTQNSIIKIKECAKNLGLYLDTDLRFERHISEACRKAYINLKLIFGHRQFLNRKVRAMLCETLVLSQFNYCDQIYGPCLKTTEIHKIQKMQNSCLRLIFGIRKHEHISHKLKEIDWLNMSKRRLLHSASLFHKIISTKMPTYLYEIIKFSSSSRHYKLITPPLHKTQMFKRSFSYNIASVYNNIPAYIKRKEKGAFKRNYFHLLLREQNN